MIKILFTFVFIIIVMFVFMVLMGAGVIMTIMSRLTGMGRNGRPTKPEDLTMLNSLAQLNPGEKIILGEVLANDDPVVGNLSDQASIDSLIAKGVIEQVPDASGIIDYRINETAWKYLKSNRRFFGA